MKKYYIVETDAVGTKEDYSDYKEVVNLTDEEFIAQSIKEGLDFNEEQFLNYYNNPHSPELGHLRILDTNKLL